MAFLVHHILSESAAKYPEKAALVFRNDTVTYAELDRESSRLASHLSALGIDRGARVGIYLNRSIFSISAAFGIMKAGATYVPIDPLCPPERLSYIINKCGITCLLATRDKLAAISQVFPARSPLEWIVVMNGLDSDTRIPGSTKLVDWQKIRQSVEAEIPRTASIETDLAYILFTSGSTGNPKGVKLSHLNSLTFVNSAHDFFRITESDRFSNICPLHFDMSVFDLFVAFKAGATVIIIPETTAAFPVKLAEAIAHHRITVWNSVPSALSLLAAYKNLENHDLSSLRLVLFAGELFPLKYLRRLQEAVPTARYCNMYGQTEANSSTYYWVDHLPEDAEGPLPIGRALPNFEVFALDMNGNRITEPGQEGELHVRASTVSSGYWEESEKTGKAFINNPLCQDTSEKVYKTGDLVHLDADGNYVFLGRKDHMIKSRGYKIEIGEIEHAVCNHPDIKTAVVVPIPDELIGNRISLLVVPLSPGTLARDDIIKHCLQRLPRYMIPEIIEFHDSLPATSSGKIDRKKLSDDILIRTSNPECCSVSYQTSGEHMV